MIWYIAITMFSGREIVLDHSYEEKFTDNKPVADSENTAQDPAQEPGVEENPRKKLTWQQNLFKDAKDILVIIGVFMLVYVLFFRAVVVVGSSMNNTLVSGDRLLVLSNLVYRQPQQGDIIVASKDSFRNGECIIKRVIATEGQEVNIDFITGTVYVDGVVLEEDYILSATLRAEGMEFPLIVDEGCVFVMGDNRMDSKDSRSPEIGLIDVREILGKAIFLILPGEDDYHKRDFGRIGVLG